jgi:ectoine hydroxylase-related dioxygenase (phytanoyl-CoA dioxygenase family)
VGTHAYCQPAGEGFETAWHQGGQYGSIRPLAACTAWVALEPSMRASGGLRGIPGAGVVDG